MDLTSEKEKIKKEIDAINNMRVIKAIKRLLAKNGADEDVPSGMVKEPPIEDWEMCTPMGRTPTREQFQEWLEKSDEGDKDMTVEEAVEYIKKRSAERKSQKKAS